MNAILYIEKDSSRNTKRQTPVTKRGGAANLFGGQGNLGTQSRACAKEHLADRQATEIAV